MRGPLDRYRPRQAHVAGAQQLALQETHQSPVFGLCSRETGEVVVDPRIPRAVAGSENTVVRVRPVLGLQEQAVDTRGEGARQPVGYESRKLTAQDVGG